MSIQANSSAGRARSTGRPPGFVPDQRSKRSSLSRAGRAWRNGFLRADVKFLLDPESHEANQPGCAKAKRNRDKAEHHLQHRVAVSAEIVEECNAKIGMREYLCLGEENQGQPRYGGEGAQSDEIVG